MRGGKRVMCVWIKVDVTVDGVGVCMCVRMRGVAEGRRREGVVRVTRQHRWHVGKTGRELGSVQRK